jgi:hypothetical protein
MSIGGPLGLVNGWGDVVQVSERPEPTLATDFWPYPDEAWRSQQPSSAGTYRDELD